MPGDYKEIQRIWGTWNDHISLPKYCFSSISSDHTQEVVPARPGHEVVGVGRVCTVFFGKSTTKHAKFIENRLRPNDPPRSDIGPHGFMPPFFIFSGLSWPVTIGLGMGQDHPGSWPMDLTWSPTCPDTRHVGPARLCVPSKKIWPATRSGLSVA